MGSSQSVPEASASIKREPSLSPLFTPSDTSLPDAADPKAEPSKYLPGDEALDHRILPTIPSWDLASPSGSREDELGSKKRIRGKKTKHSKHAHQEPQLKPTEPPESPESPEDQDTRILSPGAQYSSVADISSSGSGPHGKKPRKRRQIDTSTASQENENLQQLPTPALTARFLDQGLEEGEEGSREFGTASAEPPSLSRRKRKRKEHDGSNKKRKQKKPEADEPRAEGVTSLADAREVEGLDQETDRLEDASADVLDIGGYKVSTELETADPGNAALGADDDSAATKDNNQILLEDPSPSASRLERRSRSRPVQLALAKIEAEPAAGTEAENDNIAELKDPAEDHDVDVNDAGSFTGFANEDDNMAENFPTPESTVSSPILLGRPDTGDSRKDELDPSLAGSDDSHNEDGQTNTEEQYQDSESEEDKVLETGSDAPGGSPHDEPLGHTWANESQASSNRDDDGVGAGNTTTNGDDASLIPSDEGDHEDLFSNASDKVDFEAMDFDSDIDYDMLEGPEAKRVSEAGNLSTTGGGGGPGTTDSSPLRSVKSILKGAKTSQRPAIQRQNPQQAALDSPTSSDNGEAAHGQNNSSSLEPEESGQVSWRIDRDALDPEPQQATTADRLRTPQDRATKRRQQVAKPSFFDRDGEEERSRHESNPPADTAFSRDDQPTRPARAPDKRLIGTSDKRSGPSTSSSRVSRSTPKTSGRGRGRPRRSLLVSSQPALASPKRVKMSSRMKTESNKETAGEAATASQPPPRGRPSGSTPGDGRFTEDEIRQLKDAAARYMEDRDLPRREFNRLIQEDARLHKDLWVGIVAACPGRPRQKIILRCRKLFHNFVAWYTWTSEQDEELRQMVQKHGTKWAMIAGLLNRHQEDVRKRWEDCVKCGDNLRRDFWDFDEEKRLGKVVAETLALIQESRHEDTTYVSLVSMDDIPWDIVSERMDLTRTAKQCRDKWRKLFEEHRFDPEGNVKDYQKDDNSTLLAKARGNRERAAKELRKMAPHDKYVLIHSIRSSGVGRDTKIPWHKLVDKNYRKKWSRPARELLWYRMKQTVPDYETKSVRRISQFLLDQFEEDPLVLENIVDMDFDENDEGMNLSKPRRPVRRKSRDWPRPSSTAPVAESSDVEMSEAEHAEQTHINDDSEDGGRSSESEVEAKQETTRASSQASPEHDSRFDAEDNEAQSDASQSSGAGMHVSESDQEGPLHTTSRPRAADKIREASPPPESSDISEDEYVDAIDDTSSNELDHLPSDRSRQPSIDLSLADGLAHTEARVGINNVKVERSLSPELPSHRPTFAKKFGLKSNSTTGDESSSSISADRFRSNKRKRVSTDSILDRSKKSRAAMEDIESDTDAEASPVWESE